jgi:hypothetical protein
MQKELGESRGNQPSLHSLLDLRAGTVKDVTRESDHARYAQNILIEVAP